MSLSHQTEPGDAPHRHRRDRAGRRSLRARLVAAMLGLLGLLGLVIGVSTEIALYEAQYNQIDKQLYAAAGRHTEAVRDQAANNPAAATRRVVAPAQVVGTIGAGILDGRLRAADRLEEGGLARPLPPDVARILAAVPRDEEARTYDLGDLGDYRVVARPITDRVVLVTGLPLADMQATLYLVAGAVAAATVGAVLTAGIAGTVIVRRALRPLSRMAATAGRVAELRLDSGEVALPERVPEQDTDPHTEVGQVGAALNRMLDHVSAALAARHLSETRVRQFVADASHELRTPLAAIRGYAELARRHPEDVPPDLAHVLHRVECEAERMGTLVDDLLLLARLDAGRPLEREPVDLCLLAVNAVSDAHAAGPGHDWRLEVPEDPVVVIGDAARLHQVLANLLSNARTHTPEGTTVTAEVRSVDGRAEMCVVDAGPGIPADVLPHVFERFARGDTSRSRSAGSTGLGLAIVSAVVTAHGGTVDVESEPGRTWFAVQLPLAPSEPL